MKLYFGLLYFVLAAGTNISYRTYDRQDYCDNFLFELECLEITGIPCYVAVNGGLNSHEVVGYILMRIPEALSKKEEEAIRSKMSDPKKKGTFGYIASVEVSSGFRRRGIGTHLIRHSIDRARSVGNVLAMTLYVMATNKDAIRLYETLGFIKVMDGEIRVYAFYL
ncbi:hypothetical protein FOL47_005102 [Perkinsus chesapeaki]|uniref:N-acetyltransferase domain-containing protein n=1 Tax=Perkinsus chesapeaki TaxID=330153 RepID=A0A7J6M0A0_PERCH|nr:hypothetical protein FOL47_005102 [Perkinsus chesapeaki]